VQTTDKHRFVTISENHFQIL